MKKLMLALLVVACGPVDEAATGNPANSLPEQMLLPVADAGASSDAGTNLDGGSPADAGAPPPQYVYPSWERLDIQPQSPKAQQKYGLEAFRGRTVVVVLLEGFCPYCQSNAKVAEQLQTTLRGEKRDVEFVVLADAAAEQYVGKIGLRIFKDAEAGRPAWQAMRTGAYKHDTFVFAPNGQRSYFWEGSYTGDAPRWTQQVGEAVRKVAPVSP